MPIGGRDRLDIAYQNKDIASKIFYFKKQIIVCIQDAGIADKIMDAETSRQIKEWIRMTKVGKLYEQEKIEYANKQRENDIIYLGKEDGKSDDEIVSRLKKMLGYDDRTAVEAVSSYDSRQPLGV